MSVRKTARKSNAGQATDAPFAYAGLERIFHERGRLAVCTCLIAHPDGLSFTELQESCGLTDGNLSRHLHALSEVDIVTIARHTGSGRPKASAASRKAAAPAF